ncbi:Probable tubulin--tyrosine ligase [Sparassis crispa]|uniref:Probable tubulin--tyrosine ligase n=1 Tax=Sparassis crispa TaxID=139825 RepID=A0A401G805_9APHY|nr:Probable tubulin--tyrosine ligase [Sparassis crispa]GBE78305.1 Probable tubulin--tyrosine ligase [Sparassis crispa]
MQDFTALVSWPAAPLTDFLVRKSLLSLDPPPSTVTSLPEDYVSSPRNLLQWSTYDLIDHDLTHSYGADSRVLSSSYIIRKALIRKHFLSRCIHNYLVKHPESLLSYASPQTWELEISYADELDEMWSDDLYDLGQELDKRSNRWWILKPGMADRAMGIRLFHSKEQLQRIFEGFDEDSDEEERPGLDTNVVTSQLRHFVIQEYLSNSILVDPLEVPLDGRPKPRLKDLHGHKFHLRVYCVASGALTVYMYTRILSLFSAVRYAAPTSAVNDEDAVNGDLAAHLTNTSLQGERGEAGVRLLDELVGCHILSASPSPQEHKQPAPPRHQPRPPRAMGEVLEVDHVRSLSQAQVKEARRTAEARHLSPVLAQEDIEDIKAQISDVLAETFKAALEMSVHFQPLPNAFELYGVDFLVTHTAPFSSPSTRKYQVHILEVNSEPAIELTGPRLTWILEDLFRAIGKVCVAPFFTPVQCKEGEEHDISTWQVGDTREALRKCLEVQVRGAGSW